MSAVDRLQPTWVIDPSGSNRNTGIDGGHAIRDTDELRRRWGKRPRLTKSTTITYVGTPAGFATYDPIVANGCSLTIQGTQTASTSGTISAVATLNRASQAPWGIVHASLSSADLGKIVRIPSGARAGAYARIEKDNGSGNMRTTPWGTFSPVIDACLVAVTPVAGDPYQVVDMPQLHVGEMFFSGESDNPLNTGYPYVRLDSLTLSGDHTSSIATGSLPIFYSQSIMDRVQVGGLGIHQMAGGGSDSSQFNGSNIENGCFGVGFGRGSNTSTQLTIARGAALTLDQDCILQECTLAVFGNVYGGLVSVFDRLHSSLCVLIAPGGIYRSLPFTSTDLLWGTNNVGNGITIQSGGELFFKTLPTINGGLGVGREIRIGDITSDMLLSDVGLGVRHNPTGATIAPLTAVV